MFLFTSTAEHIMPIKIVFPQRKFVEAVGSSHASYKPVVLTFKNATVNTLNPKVPEQTPGYFGEENTYTMAVVLNDNNSKLIHTVELTALKGNCLVLVKKQLPFMFSFVMATNKLPVQSPSKSTQSSFVTFLLLQYKPSHNMLANPEKETRLK
ncbi:hypothetical protein A0J61_04270 [Choanephora cucurbitarum]|uniref:Uncharacterized protein n=1 Tax=Choanephora cucurbitarum TaxID=101091 RepID=A0A1C7NEY9_9FUNG|nr:hypothetical protein A0J61_04270 [Choanephora cucurbitarum]